MQDGPSATERPPRVPSRWLENGASEGDDMVRGAPGPGLRGPLRAGRNRHRDPGRLKRLSYSVTSMAGATAQRVGPAERIFRPLESLPLGPIWPGVIVAVGLGASFVGWHAAAGVLDEFFPPSRAPLPTPDARVHLTVGILTGFLVAVSRYEALHWRRDLLSLHPLTSLSEAELSRVIDAERAVGRRELLLFMGAGVLLGIAMVPASSATPRSSCGRTLT